jgi:hemerythrin
MTLINCKKLLNVGVQQFDDEHFLLVAIINQLHDAIKAGTGSQAIQSTLQQLTDFSLRHFKAEEELLELHGYPGLAEHRQAHQTILKQLADIQTDFNENTVTIQQNVMQFLLDWLINHTKSVDKQYGPFLNSKGVY